MTAPGPARLPLVGAVPRILSFILDPLAYTQRLFARYGPVAAIVQGHAQMMTPRSLGLYAVTGAELNREILTQHDRYRMYALSGAFFPDDQRMTWARRWSGLGRFVGLAEPDRLEPARRTLTGLFHVNGDEHRRHRRLLQPAFVKSRIDAYRNDMVTITEEMLAKWTVGEERDVLADLTELTLRIATKTLFGGDAGERGVALARLVVEWGLLLFRPGMVLRFDVGRLPYRRWLDLTQRIDDETLAIVRETQAKVRADEAAGRPIAGDMLSMLVAARDEDGSALDEDELVGHAGVIFAAGHETSTNALAWTLFLLAEHPQIAAELVSELTSVLKGEAPTVEQLGKLPLLDAVVKESMRVLPPVPLHPRVTAEDVVLGGIPIPAQSEVFVSIYQLHHDPAVFTDPQRFDPSRWTRIKPSPYEYNPFSAGPRMCIGAGFAVMEIKIALALILQRFRVERLPGVRVDYRVAITMAPLHGLRMRIRKADGAWAAARRSVGPVLGKVNSLVDLPR
ncbi:MAG: cytochrome hydroxylase [Labilithrix sp.]|nr:cytochrome hydroxylase [Labilithrix sp.]